MADSVKCRICDEETHDSVGMPLGTVLVYQKVNGTIRLAKNLELKSPIFFVHEACVERLNDR